MSSEIRSFTLKESLGQLVIHQLPFYHDRTDVKEDEIPENFKDLAKTKRMELIGKVVHKEIHGPVACTANK